MSNDELNPADVGVDYILPRFNIEVMEDGDIVLFGRRLSLIKVEQLVADLRRAGGLAIEEPDGDPMMLRASRIIAAVAATQSIPVEKLTGKGRDERASRARYIAVYVVRKLCPDLSQEDVGFVFDRERSSIASAIIESRKREKWDEGFRDMVAMAMAEAKEVL